MKTLDEFRSCLSVDHEEAIEYLFEIIVQLENRIKEIEILHPEIDFK